MVMNTGTSTAGTRTSSAPDHKQPQMKTRVSSASWPACCQFIPDQTLPIPDAFVAVCNQGRHLFTWSFENLFN